MRASARASKRPRANERLAISGAEKFRIALEALRIFSRSFERDRELLARAPKPTVPQTVMAIVARVPRDVSRFASANVP